MSLIGENETTESEFDGQGEKVLRDLVVDVVPGRSLPLLMINIQR